MSGSPKTAGDPGRHAISMFRKILVPVVHGCDPQDAVTAARAIAGERSVLLIGFVPVVDDDSLSVGATEARHVRKTLRRFSDGRRVRSRARVRVSHRPWAEIAEAVRSEGADLLVLTYPDVLDAMCVPPHDSMSSLPCAVALVRGPVPEKPKQVLMAVRGGPNADLALRVSLALHRSQGSSINSLHAVPTPLEGATDAPFMGLSRVLANLPEVKHREVSTKDPVGLIVKATRYADLMVLGAGAHVSPDGPGIGAIAAELLDRTRVGALVVKTKDQTSVPPESEETGRAAISVLVDKWFAENTWHAGEFSDLEDLLTIKENRGVTVSLALPALNEEKTVGTVIETCKRALMDEVPLLDEIVLIDSNSTDKTREIAADLGVPVYIHQQILPAYGARRGKGEALWKSLFVTRGDIIVWIDTDIVNIHPRFVYGILGPLLLHQRCVYAKGFYRRPLKVGEKMQAGGGGRVTELTARPLINLFYPELSGLIQPLSGEYGGLRSALERIPFYSGYGVEIGMIIDLLEQFGLQGIAQVDLLERIHHNQPLESLGKMSFAIIQAVMRKLERRGFPKVQEVNKTLKLIRREAKRYFLDVETIAEEERPPMIEIPEYRAVRPR